MKRLWVLVFLYFCLPASTNAQTRPQSELERRVQALEEQVKALQAELAALKAAASAQPPLPHQHNPRRPRRWQRRQRAATWRRPRRFPSAAVRPSGDC